MGISTVDAKKMTVWEMSAVTQRWIEAHDTDSHRPGAPLSEAEKDDIWDWMQTKQRPLTLKEARAKANGRGSAAATQTPGR